MPPKNTQDQRTKHATFILDQVIALGIPLTFNINHVARNLDLSVNGAKSRIREVKKHNPQLKLSFISTGKSSAGPPGSNRGSAADNAPRSTPATATRSGRGRKKQGVDDAGSAGMADDDEEVDVGDDVGTALLKKSKSKSITGGKKRTTRTLPKTTQEDTNDSNGDDVTKEQEARHKTPRTRTGRRSAGLEDDEEVSLPVHAPKSRHAASSKAKMRVEKDEAEDHEEDVSNDAIANGTGLEEEVMKQDDMDESAAVGNNTFVERLLDGTSTDVLGRTKRKRSIPPQTPSPTPSWTMLESSDLMPSSDLPSTPGSTKEESRAAVAAQGDTPSKPPPGKKAKFDAADAAAVKQAADDVSKPVAFAETNIAGGDADDMPGMELDETVDSSALEGQPSSVPSAIVAKQGLEPEDTNQVSHKDLVKSVELATVASDEKACAQGAIMKSQRVDKAGVAREGAEYGAANASESTSPADKPAQTHARERRSQFFTTPLRWMSYSREARPAEPPNAFEASVDDEGRPYPQRQGWTPQVQSAFRREVYHANISTIASLTDPSYQKMTSPVPTRAALRALAELCHPERSFARQYSASRRTSLCSGPGLSSRPASCRRGLSPAAIRARWKTTVIDSPEPQVFANDPTRYDAQNRTGPEPQAQGTEDPQANASGPVLPDITNYYTLFPKTIPYGPPRGTPSIPDSSTLTQGDHPPASFHINPRDLRKEFLQLQSMHHPDKFPAGSVAHQRAYALSTLLNNAYKTLSDPLLRAQYLLENLYNIDVMSEDNSAHPTDPETLMIVMEAQEELESATNNGGEEIVGRLKADNRGRIRETEEELAAAFEAGDADRAKNESVKLKYWRSLESGLQDWEPGKEVRLTH